MMLRVTFDKGPHVLFEQPDDMSYVAIAALAARGFWHNKTFYPPQGIRSIIIQEPGDGQG